MSRAPGTMDEDPPVLHESRELFVAVEPQLRRQIVRAVLVLAGVAVVIGLVVALTATAALRMAGISGGDDGPPPSVAEPEPDEVPTPETVEPTPSKSPSSGKSPDSSKSPKDEKSKKPKPQPIKLTAGTNAAASMQQVNLNGNYPGGNGVTLKVQRREGGNWAPFPTSAQVQGGTFSTHVALGQPGPNRLRVLDPQSGKTSNVVVIRIQ